MDIYKTFLPIHVVDESSSKQILPPKIHKNTCPNNFLSFKSESNGGMQLPRTLKRNSSSLPKILNVMAAFPFVKGVPLLRIFMNNAIAWEWEQISILTSFLALAILSRRAVISSFSCAEDPIEQLWPLCFLYRPVQLLHSTPAAEKSMWQCTLLVR